MQKLSPFVTLGVIFLCSRAVFYAMGVHFDASPLECFTQIIEPELLRTRLFESIYYLHSQPPLFNLFLGVVLKIFPTNYVPVFQISYLGLGMTLMFTLFSLMKELKVNHAVNLVLTTYFMISPAVILYENWLFYSYPEAVGLTLAAYSLIRYVKEGRRKDGIFFFVCLMVLVLLRATFHVAWFLACVLLLVFLKKGDRRSVIALAAVPFIVIMAWQIKNALLFKSLTSGSAYLNTTLARMAICLLNEEERGQLQREGIVSKMTLQAVCKEWALDPAHVKDFALRPTGIPILDNPIRCNQIIPNMNSLFAMQASKVYAKDAWTVLKRFPSGYWRAVKRAYMTYVFPGPTDAYLENRHAIGRYERGFNLMFLPINTGDFDIHWFNQILYPVQWTWSIRIVVGILIASYAGLIVFGLRSVWLARRRGEDPAAFACLGFLMFNILYITLLMNGLEMDANNRYRFAIDPFYIILFGLLITELLHHKRESV